MPDIRESLIRILGFARKELMGILRQPRLVVILIMGPFLILLLFGIGYTNTERTRTTLIVLPEDSVLYDQIDAMTQRFSGINFAGIVSDEAAADEALLSGEVDLLMIAPGDPMQDVREGNRAVIEMRHTEIDPLEIIVVSQIERVLTDVINRDVLIEAVNSGQRQAVSIEEQVGGARADAAAAQAQLEANNVLGAAVALNTLSQRVQLLAFALSEGLAAFEGVQRLETPDSDQVQGIFGSMATIQSLSAQLETLDPTQESFAREALLAEQMVNEFDRMETLLEGVLQLNPEVVARPFEGKIENLSRVALGPIDFYVPGVISLLLQHMALTLAALSLVREVSGGSIELFRAAPVSALEALLGKMISYLLLTAVLAAILSALVVFGLGTPMLGTWAAFTATVLALLFASISMGFAISVISNTDTQAVQYSMIVLLASIFFSGFFIALHRLAEYVGVVSWTLPATYGTALLQEVMLRGWSLDPLLIGGLLLLGLVLFLFSWWRLSRQMASV